MRKVFLSNYKRYISLIILVLFFFGMVSIPENLVKAIEKPVLQKEAFENGFIDSKNSSSNNENSVFHISGLKITSKDTIKLGETIDLRVDSYDENGNKNQINGKWSLIEEINGVYIKDNKLTVSNEVDTNKMIKIKVEEEEYVDTKEIIIEKEVQEELYKYTINYFRQDNNYDGWNLWLWEDGKEGKTYEFNKSKQGEKGFARAEYEFPSNKINFIIKKGDWEDREPGGDRNIKVEKEREVEVWLVSGDEEVYYSKDDIDTSLKIKAAIMDNLTDIMVTANGTISDDYLKTFSLVNKTSKRNIPIKVSRISDNEVKLKVEDKNDINVKNIYEVNCPGFSPKIVTFRKILDDSKFYYSESDLGLTFNSKKPVFKLWAPTATDVNLVIYENQGIYNDEGKVTDHSDGYEISMKEENGVWQVDLEENLEGKYYMYKVTFADGKSNYAIDPYIKSVSANGQRGFIINTSSIKSENLGKVSKPELIKSTDSIIYELHVRDFSISEDSGIKNKGKFKGFTEEGTKIPGTDIKTGVDHLRELGITHVHLLPSYDYGSVNEKSTKPEFNWGYDPQNYNTPEGSYSTDVSNPKTRIKEFKDMVQVLHKNGIRVIMDVVYNHTQNVGGSPFDAIIPGYFYRTDNAGNYTNGSGCGNEVASERPMVRKYIKDSVKYWAREYDIDGFRFDLLGLIDIKTITEITNEVREEIDPTIVIYGEPWTGGASALPSDQQTLKGSQKDKDFAVFNDNFRAAIKGGSDDGSQGFATGASSKELDIVKGIKGSIYDFTNGPNEVINYVTAHDNLNLWDKILKASGKDKEAGFLEIKDGSLIGEDAKNYSSVEEAVKKKAKPHSVITEENLLDNELVKRSILTTGIIMTSQGIPFFQAGDEFLRSKYGDHNSYKSPDAINKINWENKEKYKEVFDYYKGLIDLRKNHPAFRIDTKEGINKNLVVTKSNENIVVFELKDYANNDSWKNIVVAYNANNSHKEINLSKSTNWNVVVNGEKAGTEVIETLNNTSKVTIAPLSVMVLYDEGVDNSDLIPTIIEVSPKTLGVNPGEFKFIRAVVKDQNGRVMSGQKINWTIEDEEIVRVKDSKIYGLKEGKTTVTLTCGEAKATIEVNVAKLIPKEIKIHGSDNIYEGKHIELMAEVKDQFGQVLNKVDLEWKSSDETIATINDLGVVTGIKPGIVKIIAKAGEVECTKEIEIKKYVKKFIEFNYVRPDKNYHGWNIWTWQTGVKDGQQDFTEFKEGIAKAKFEVSPDAKDVGFVIRKGENWEEKDPYDSDRYITVHDNMAVTKVTVRSGEKDIFTVPSIKKASINSNNLEFKYRDEKLYEENNQESIEKVQVKVKKKQSFLSRLFGKGLEEIYDMTYDAKNEFFEYTLENIKEGLYVYRFLITKDGKIHETEPEEIQYKTLKINVEGSVSEKEVNYDENTLVKVSLNGKDASKDNIKEVYMDLTEVGGPSEVSMDTMLLEQSIGIKDTVTTGEKNIDIVVVDKNGVDHKGSVKVTVKSKASTGDLDFGFDESRIYFMVTDRFFNGDNSNDDPHNLGYDKNSPMTYHGGDFKGITDKIPYLKDLGINTVWITPIVSNTDFNQKFSSGGEQYSYHGYWAKDFKSLDPHLGTMDDFKNMIDVAHDNGIKIMVDVVLNHGGYGMKSIDGNSEAINYPTDEDRNKFNGMFRENPGNDFITQELSGLPDFKTEDKEVREKIIKWQSNWIEKSKTDKGNTIDYFRVDTVKHVDNTTWKSFKNKLTEIDPKFKIIGEFYGADINSDGGQLRNGQMDGLLDFLYKSKTFDLVNGNIESTSKYLDERVAKMDNTAVMGQFLSSHDEDGFLSKVNGDLGKQMVGSTLQITDKGIPVIYYGEELGFTGKAENDGNRYDMPWDRVNDEKYKGVFNHYKKLLNIRKDYSELFSKGDRITLGGGNEDKYHLYSRNYNGQSLFIGLNIDDKDKSVKIPVAYKEGKIIKDLYNDKEYKVDKDNNIKDNNINVILPKMKDGGTAIFALKENKLEEVKVTKVSLDKSNLNLKQGETARLIAEIEPKNATSKEVIWISSNDKVATVDKDGNVTGVNQGKATITVETKEGNHKASCEVVVKNNQEGTEEPVLPENIKVSGISLNKDKVTLKVNDTTKLIAKINPENATNKNVRWVSSDESIAKVDENGKVKGVSEGKVTITVTTENGDYKARCIINVVKNLPITGGHSSLLLIGGGVLLIALGVSLFIRKKKNENKK